MQELRLSAAGCKDQNLYLMVQKWLIHPDKFNWSIFKIKKFYFKSKTHSSLLMSAYDLTKLKSLVIIMPKLFSKTYYYSCTPKFLWIVRTI